MARVCRSVQRPSGCERVWWVARPQGASASHQRAANWCVNGIAAGWHCRVHASFTDAFARFRKRFRHVAEAHPRHGPDDGHAPVGADIAAAGRTRPATMAHLTSPRSVEATCSETRTRRPSRAPCAADPASGSTIAGATLGPRHGVTGLQTRLHVSDTQSSSGNSSGGILRPLTIQTTNRTGGSVESVRPTVSTNARLWCRGVEDQTNARPDRRGNDCDGQRERPVDGRLAVASADKSESHYLVLRGWFASRGRRAHHGSKRSAGLRPSPVTAVPSAETATALAIAQPLRSTPAATRSSLTVRTSRSPSHTTAVWETNRCSCVRKQHPTHRSPSPETLDGMEIASLERSGRI